MKAQTFAECSMPPPHFWVFLLICLAILAGTSCSGVTVRGPIAFMGNQNAEKIKSKEYYENGTVKSELEIVGYGTINPNPELTAAVGEAYNTKILTDGFVDVTKSTVANPNETPPLAKDPNTLPRNPNIIPRDPQVIPLNPNVIPK